MVHRGGPSERARATQEVGVRFGWVGPQTVEEEEADLVAAVAASLHINPPAPKPPSGEASGKPELGPSSASAPVSGTTTVPDPSSGSVPVSGTTTTSGSVPASGTTTVPAAKATPKRAAYKFYSLTRVPTDQEDKLGIWKCSGWREMAQILHLPQQRLEGTGFHLRGFDAEQGAVEYWVKEGWELPAPVHY